MNRLFLRSILSQSRLTLTQFRSFLVTASVSKKIPLPGDPVYDEHLVDFGRKIEKIDDNIIVKEYKCENLPDEPFQEREDIGARIEEFQCNKTYFRVEGIYPLKVVMRLQNQMMEHLCDKRMDHIIETILVKDESILDQLPDHYVDFMEVLIVPDSISKESKNQHFSIQHALENKGIIGIGKRPNPEMIGFLRDEFIKENGGDLPLGNVRVIVEALKHFENAKNIIDTCALNGVQSIHLSPYSVDILAPPMVTRSQGSVLSLPIYQNISYDYFQYVKDVDGVRYPPLLVLLDGSVDKSKPGDFSNVLDKNDDESSEFDDQIIETVSYTDVDWTYPNIIVVFGQTSYGLSRKIARKAVQYDGCLSYIPTSIDIPLSLSTALSATIFEASRVNKHM